MKYWIVAVISFYLSACSLDVSSRKDNESVISTPTVEVALAPENFAVAYDGHGSVDFDASHITFAPKASTSSGETHGSLIFLQDTVDHPLLDFELTVEMAVLEQLRQNSPANDWEVFWLFFNYNATADNEKTTNYFITKPHNGAELGLAHGELGQRFLSTEGSAKTAIGDRHTFRFVRAGQTFTVYRDDVLFYSYSDTRAFPQRLYSSKGSIGLYSEDAKIQIYSMKLRRMDGRTPASSPRTITLTSDIQVKAPGAQRQLSISLNDSSQFGTLFWSCNFRKLVGAITDAVKKDCLSAGSLNSSGVYTWTPSFSDIGAWFYDFEVSEPFSGFSKKSAYVQVRPAWTANPLFLYDPQFSLEKKLEDQTVLVTRDLASTENNKTLPWPALIGVDSLSLNGLTETAPWVQDNDTGQGALHFNGLHNDAGLELPVSNLGSMKDLRLSYWFKRDNSDSKVALEAPHTNGALESRHWYGAISSRYTDGDSEVACYDTAAASNDWTFVTSQVTGSALKTFVNGRLVCSAALSATYEFLSPMKIAPRSQTFFPFAGRISEIAGYRQSTEQEIFNDFLTTAERYRKNKVGAIDTNGIVLHWDMSNAEGGMAPSPTGAVNSLFDLGPVSFSKVIGGFNGTAFSGYVTSTPKSSSLVFDGVDDWIQIPAHSSLSLGPSWTIEGWIQPGVALGNDTNYPPTDVRYPLFKPVFEKAYFNNASKLSHGFGLRIGTENSVTAFVVNNLGNTETVPGATLNLAPTTWIHVAATFDKATSTLSVFLNGTLDGANRVNLKRDPTGVNQSDGDVISGLSDAFVGLTADVDARRRFNGRLAVLRVYNRALTTQQISFQCKAQQSRYGVSCH